MNAFGALESVRARRVGGRKLDFIPFKLNRLRSLTLSPNLSRRITIFIFIVNAVVAISIIIIPKRATADLDKNDINNIEDINIKYHFKSIFGMYTDGKNKFLCVETSDNRIIFWNPENYKISFLPKGCPPGSPMMEIRALVTARNIAGSPERIISSDVSFNHGASISGDSNSHNNCDPNFYHYYDITYEDGKVESFYLIARLKKPVLYNYREECGNDSQVLQRFDDILVLNSIYLGNDKTLFYSPDERIFEPIILIIRSMPKTIWASRNRIFVVPKEFLFAKLNDIDDLDERYRKVISVISGK